MRYNRKGATNISGSPDIEMWNAEIRKLWKFKHLLTLREEEIIKRITSKLP